MTKCGKDILLPREGSEQNQRFIEQLNPESVKLNDYGVKEWMRFAYNFAKHVNYFSTDNQEVPSGDWRNFFKAEDELEDFIKEVDNGGNVTPHLALFVVFVKLLEISKERFNRLTQRHLDFYYQQVLQIEKQTATPDKVHVIFELAKNASSQIIEKGTALDAGKDANGNKLSYKTTEDIVVNQAKVTQLKSVYNDTENHKIKAAEVANSHDGLGGDFPDDEKNWWPFGYYEALPQDSTNDLREFPELENAQFGFSVAGEILELQEGEREVSLEITFDKKLSEAYSIADLQSSFKVFCTGEKDWLGPFIPNSTSNNTKKVLKLAFVIPKHEKPVVNYNQKVHSGNYQTSSPVCKVLIDTGNERACEIFNSLQGMSISSVDINVDVKGISGLKLHNDNGAINAQKPFYPFGTIPVKKSKFYIDYDELYKKKWTDLTLDIEWKNTPDNFKDWYFAYRKPVKSKISSIDYMCGIYKVLDMDKNGGKVVSQKVGDIQALPENFTLQLNSQTDNLYVKNDKHFELTVEKNEAETWKSISGKKNVSLFEKTPHGTFALNLPLTNDGKIDAIRLSLNQSFYQELYPQIYAMALTNQDKNVLVPNEAYTPLVESIKMTYNASASIKVAGGKYTQNDFTLFHENPFGQALECVLQKKEQAVLKPELAQKLNLISEFLAGGELYIGIENAKPRQIISLLIQVLEGSEKPDNTPFAESKKVEWDILCSNQWKKLNAADILANEIDNFLKSGILKFSVPKEANIDNTRLPSGALWLRARINKNYNLVSKAIGIHAQANVAVCDADANKESSIQTNLPENSISKLVNRVSKVKAVLQPYNSFSGVPAENDKAYYRRVSERLRHKNRAITVWDYEHLVLQQFPEIYKVKCLNHTNSKPADESSIVSFLAPGHVTLLLIPDIVNRNVFDIYKPSVSAATLNRIEKFLHARNSSLINIHVENPDYEEVSVCLKVKFNSDIDENYYLNVLNDDITKLLSPWAFNREVGLQFGQTFHKSVLVKYIEELGYVDYITDVKLFQLTKLSSTTIGDEVKVASPSSPMAVLVSAKTHDVKPADITCPVK